MTPEALTALKASIVKWERNERAENYDDVRMGIIECPLCKIFNTGPDYCGGCPIKQKTGLRYCDGTPYDHARKSLAHWGAGIGTRESFREAFRAAAHAETEFLRSLLPQGEPV